MVPNDNTKSANPTSPPATTGQASNCANKKTLALNKREGGRPRAH